MFCDLNISVSPSSSNDLIEEILAQASELGYRAVALTYEVDVSDFKEKPKKKNENAEIDLVPQPANVTTFRGKFLNLEIYTRINFVISDSDNIRKVLQAKNTKLYDIVSVQPLKLIVLKSLVGVVDVDIISYNPQEKCSWVLSRKLYNQLVSQDVYFELTYVPAVLSHVARKNLISLSHAYHAVGKSKNIIVSSGAFSPHHFRGPYDVMTFNLLFGLNEEQASTAISRNCKLLLLRAKKRRQGKIVVYISKLDEKKICLDSSPMESLDDC